MIKSIIILTVVYSAINVAIALFASVESKRELYNPIQIYKDHEVNWFGCILMTLFTHIMIPIGAIVYWFYVLCTCGRGN